MSTLQFDPNQLGFNADVIVVGGGLSGLVATWRLVREGVDVILLEAKERVGGRISSGTFNGETYDLGARWIKQTATQTHQIVHELGVQLFPQYHDGESVIEIGKHKKRFKHRAPLFAPHVQYEYHRIIRILNRLAYTLQHRTSKNAAKIAQLDAISFGAWLQQHSRNTYVTELFTVLSHVHFCAEPSEISIVFVIDQVHAFRGAQHIFPLRPAINQERIVGGIQRITDRLAQQLRPQIYVDTPVLALRQDDDSVTAYSRGASYRARYAIIATPPVVASQMYHEPALPAQRDALHQRMIMGRDITAILCYDYPFWRENKKSGFMLSNRGPASLVHDVSPHTSTEGALACHIIGDNATHWGAQPRGERLKALVAQLATWLGDEAMAYRGMIERDWNNERWSRGTVGFMPPGSANFVHALYTPVGRLHWAGSETASEWTGSLEGAIEAGERTAAEIISQLSAGGYLRRS